MNQVNYLTITQLSRYLKYKFDEDVNLKKVYLKGEISNFKAHTRGHYYFTLKDENSRISAVMFHSNVIKIKFLPQDGMKVLVTGKVTIYEASGGYQIYVEDMLEDGVGNLYVAFEQLKKKLDKEGLFAKEHKRKIPKMPKKIGIVTASTGAAIRDILTTIKRRYPIVETILFPALVQGEYAADDIARKIRIANDYDIDVLIVGRGGGSIEDLWPFNEEVVARAIYDSRVPIISAVGHEVDFTIADFVADLRAPTPTAAAELAVVDINTIFDYLKTVKVRSYNAINNLITSYRDRIDRINDSYIIRKPSNIYEIKEQKLDMLIDQVNISINRVIEINKVKLFKFSESYILNNPDMLYVMKEEKLNNLINKINKEVDIIYKSKNNILDNIVGKLTVLNPLSTISRGYTITRYNNKVIKSVKEVGLKEKINIEFKDGIIDALIEGISDK